MDANSKPIVFALVGGGWRAEFFLRIAQALPHRFTVSGVLLRDPAKHAAFEARWGVEVFSSLDPLLATNPAFVVLSVPREAAPQLMQSLAERQVPVLCETPPAADLEGLTALHGLTQNGTRIQVAEQYQFQPLHAARIALARSGKLGRVHQARVALAHDYHAISLIRRLLGIGFENATIRATAFGSEVIAGPDRSGPPQGERLEAERTILATLDFGDRLGVYDFAEWSHYFSWIRSHRVLVQGSQGEISDQGLRYLADFQTPVELELIRRDAGQGGNLEGFHHQGILAGGEWVYRNPFAPARLSDEEIAIATCLEKMALYAAGGPSFYSLPEASQDHYLALMIHRALQTGQPIQTQTQAWADSPGI